MEHKIFSDVDGMYSTVAFQLEFVNFLNIEFVIVSLSFCYSAFLLQPFLLQKPLLFVLCKHLFVCFYFFDLIHFSFVGLFYNIYELIRA